MLAMTPAVVGNGNGNGSGGTNGVSVGGGGGVGAHTLTSATNATSHLPTTISGSTGAFGIKGNAITTPLHSNMASPKLSPAANEPLPSFKSLNLPMSE